MKFKLSSGVKILLAVVYFVFVFKWAYMLKSIPDGKALEKVQVSTHRIVNKFNATSYIMDEPVDSGHPYKRNGFNIVVSHRISSDRIIPDTRQTECLDQVYSNSLPSTSVIICFHNEARSTLLRTVISVLNRSPPSLIHEIILVDDFSDDPNDGILLEALPKVKVLRNNAREGLIRSRIAGADYASAPVLTFLDSHCECNVGWLEPLLQRVMEDSHVIVCPVIDWIDSNLFLYNRTDPNLIAVFDWKLQLTWNRISQNKLFEGRQSSISPVKTPVIAGGLFSINRQRFIETGKYDEEMDIWGGENMGIEISFRTWMCGGSMEIVPCSRVGHVFRSGQPYSFPKGKTATTDKNNNRVAEVWMDEYKELYYLAKHNDKGRGYGKISLRKRLNCSTFSWYIENVFPKLKYMVGEIQQDGYCLELQWTTGEHNPRLGVGPCNVKNNNQIWTVTSSQNFESHYGWHLTFDNKDHSVSVRPTTGLFNQRWIYSHDERTIVNLEKGHCLSRSQWKVTGKICKKHSAHQRWTISMRKPHNVQ